MFGPSTPAGNNGVSDNHAAGTNNVPGASAASGISFDHSVLDNSDWNNPGTEMWYLPPGPALFQNMENSAVAMTAEGVNVGGLDLLEYMVMDPGEFSNLDGYQQ